MHAAALRVELRIPNTRSLKEKRGKVKAVTSMLTSKFAVSVAEVGFHDQWQRTTIGVAAVAPQLGQLDRIIHSVRRALDSHPDIELLAMGVSFLEEPA